MPRLLRDLKDSLDIPISFANSVDVKINSFSILITLKRKILRGQYKWSNTGVSVVLEQ